MIHTFKDENRWLSNMVLVNVHFNGLTYKSVEHAYQSAKSDSLDWKLFCFSEESPYKVKIKSNDITRVNEWDDIKINVMEFLLNQKFRQEPFKSKLLATGDENIQEGNEWGDTFWGVDLKTSPNIGENHLGRLIMKIRDKIKEE